MVLWSEGAAIHGIGEYAVMVEQAEDLAAITASPEIIGLLDAGIKVIGAKVLTKSGRIQGKITEYSVDDTGKITDCEVELCEGQGDARLDSETILTFGKEVIIIADQISA